MGLAGVKNKRKIGNDPNNTKWARNTDTFGHKILRSKGWEPGQYLGKKDEAYAAFHTAASASYIRAVLREDNLGIGAKTSGNGTADECVGLDGFKDLLGRLNGQSEEVIEKQRHVRENVKMTLYVERRFGPMRFVRGGLLVGDSMKEDEEAEPKTETKDSSDATISPSTSTSEELSRKKSKSEKKEKSKKRKAESDDDDAESSDSKKDGKSKRRKKDKSRSASEEEPEKAEEEGKSREGGEKEKAGKKKEKKEKKDKKEKRDKKEKKERKERKEKEKEAKKEKKKRKEEKKEKKRREAEDTDELPAKSAPVATVNSVVAGPSSLTSSRHLSRRRYIAQKRAAVMDPQALKQIFMLKA